MSEIDHEWIDALERTHSAVCKFARNEFSANVRKIIYRMRRFPASGVYGDEFKHKTLWDEYCHEQDNGPSEPLIVMAWGETLSPYFEEVLKSIPADTAILLSIYSLWELEGPLEICGSIWLDGMKQMLENSLIDEALGSDKN
jgi:hypothetical protein